MSTNSRHTPGPWTVDEPHQIWSEKAREYVAITQVEDFETLPRDQVEANARLIAAAPELLDALEECLSCEFAVTDKQAIAKARVAIAKATGSAT